MNRRQLLKNLGLGAGILVVGPSTLSLLQSCVNEPKQNFEPVFLSASNAFVLREVLDVIIPKTDTPGASDLNIAEFIDSYMDQVASEDRQKSFKDNADAFEGAFQARFDKAASKGTKEDFEEIIERYLRANPSDVEPEEVPQRTTETQDPLDENPEQAMNYDSGALAYLENVRDLGVWAWKNSEEIGENVLWYDPIPGVYIPCGTLDELGNGKAMSL